MTQGTLTIASLALVLAVGAVDAPLTAAQVQPFGVRLSWQGSCFLSFSTNASDGDTGPLVGTSFEFVEKGATCFMFVPESGYYEAGWTGGAIASLGRLLIDARAGGSPYYGGSATGWFLAEWGDTLHVESPTLPPGTPVSLRFGLGLDAWFGDYPFGGGPCIGNDARTEAVFEAIATADTPAGGLSIVARPCPPDAPLPASFLLTVPVGASVPVRGTLRIDTQAFGSAIHAIGDVDAVDYRFTIDPVAPDVDYTTASGVDYRSAGVPVCGNHVVEAGEGCDDGNLADGDCCSSLCFPNPSGSACTDDGDPCTSDTCDGSGTCRHMPAPERDRDDDGVCDVVDACTNVGGGRDLAAEPPPRLFLRGVGLDPIAGNDRLLLRGEITLPPGGLFASIDPLSTGMRIVLRGADRVPRLDAVLPAVAYAGRGSQGWKPSNDRRTWRWIDRTGSIAGLVKIVVAARGAPPAERARIRVVGQRGTYVVGAADLPIQATMTLGGPFMAQAGFCGETSFGAADCAVRGDGTRIECVGP